MGKSLAAIAGVEAVVCAYAFAHWRTTGLEGTLILGALCACIGAVIVWVLVKVWKDLGG